MRWPPPTSTTSSRTIPSSNGNKRIGYIAAMVFLEANGIETDVSSELYDLTIAVASGTMSKEEVAADFRRRFPIR